MVLLYIPGNAQKKTDTIFLKNKDRVIGEIKDMRNGVLTVETDYSDQDFKITWVDIHQIKSRQTFVLSLTTGVRLYSRIKIDTTDTKKILLEYHGLKISTTINEIVYIKSAESKFLSRLDASLSFAFNYTKSNNLKQLTVKGTLGYTSTFWSASGSYNSVRSGQTDTDEIQRTDADVGFRYFLKNNYFLSLSSEFLSNDEQKLKLRVLAKSGLGKYFVHTNKLYMGGILGAAWNNEQYSAPENISRNSLESYFTIELNMFDIKDFSLLTNGSCYLSLTEGSRFRMDYKIDLKYDLPYDFFIKFGFTLNYDNQPVQEASTNDYIFQTTFGWEL
jgi:hypothetical protein